METAKTLKDISIHVRKYGRDYAYLEIRHKNKLTLDNIVIFIFDNLATIQYSKPYCEKYLCLVLEWMVNHLTQNARIEITLVPTALRSDHEHLGP